MHLNHTLRLDFVFTFRFVYFRSLPNMTEVELHKRSFRGGFITFLKRSLSIVLIKCDARILCELKVTIRKHKKYFSVFLKLMPKYSRFEEQFFKIIFSSVFISRATMHSLAR